MGGWNKVNIVQHFWEQVDKRGPREPGVDGRCWLWTGQRLKNDGCGRFQFRVDDTQHSMVAHRACWYLLHRELPQILKRACPNILCVRPRHYSPETNVDNARYIIKFNKEVKLCRKGHPRVEGSRRCRTCATEWQSAYFKTPHGRAVHTRSQAEYAAKQRAKKKGLTPV